MIEQILTYLRGSVSVYGLFAIWSLFRKPEPTPMLEEDDGVIRYVVPCPVVSDDPQIRDMGLMTREEIVEYYGTGVYIERDGSLHEVGTIPRDVWDGLRPANDA